MTATTPVPAATTDSTGYVIPREARNVLALHDKLGLVTVVRPDTRSARVLMEVVIDGETKHFARKAHTVKIFRSHGRLVKAGSAAAAKIIAKHAEA